jgi:hypothetical protein
MFIEKAIYRIKESSDQFEEMEISNRLSFLLQTMHKCAVFFFLFMKSKEKDGLSSNNRHITRQIGYLDSAITATMYLTRQIGYLDS